MRHRRLGLWVVVLSGLSNPIPYLFAEDEKPAENAVDADKAKSELRLKFMLGALNRYDVYVGAERERAKLLPDPALRWSNPVSGVQDGLVGVYTPGGRPAAVVQFAFHGKGFQVHEFYSVTSEPLEMLRSGNSIWKPSKAVFAWQDVTEAPAPAAAATLRLPQMRKLAAEFTVVDDFGWDKKEKQILRLLTQPLHRYTDDARGVVDGALFSFVMGTNPEANLLLEAVRTEQGLKWQFGFSPMTIYALTASRKDVDVWSIGERKVFNSYDTAFRVGPYPAEPGESIPD
jgi:hypothetical protein